MNEIHTCLFLGVNNGNTDDNFYRKDLAWPTDSFTRGMEIIRVCFVGSMIGRVLWRGMTRAERIAVLKFALCTVAVAVALGG